MICERVENHNKKSALIGGFLCCGLCKTVEVV
jgi:hypothetical protein